MQETFNTLLGNASYPRSHARLLAAAEKESGAWLHALLISSIGLWMDDNVVRTVAGLDLGVPFCHPHHCHHCEGEVDELATLSCIRSEACHLHHAAINSTTQRSLAAAQIPSTLEPLDLSRTDGKHPDGVTIAPWRTGHPLVWDATCSDTYVIFPMWPIP